MADKQKLHETLAALIDDDSDKATDALHDFITEKTREILGLDEACGKPHTEEEEDTEEKCEKCGKEKCECDDKKEEKEDEKDDEKEDEEEDK